MQSRAEFFLIFRNEENKYIIIIIPNSNGYVVIKETRI